MLPVVRFLIHTLSPVATLWTETYPNGKIGRSVHDGTIKVIKENLLDLKAKAFSKHFKSLSIQFESRIKTHEGVLHPKIQRFFKEQRAPYSVDEKDPEQIHQFKNIANALYALTEGLAKIESTPTELFLSEGSINAIEVFFENLQALPILLSTTPLNLNETFKSEFNILKEMGQDLSPFVESALVPFVEGMTSNRWSYHMGTALGEILEHTDIITPTYDFNRLSALTQYCSHNIDTLTTQIEALSPKIKADAEVIKRNYDALDPQSLQNIEQHCQRLVSVLSNIFDGGALLSNPYKWYQLSLLSSPLIEIVKILKTQVGQVSDETKKMLEANIYRLKFDVIIPIVVYFDKLEAYFYLKPQTLTQPLIQKLTRFYGAVVKSASMLFKVDSPLKVLEEGVFYQKRKAAIWPQIAAYQIKIYHLKTQHEAFKRFFGPIEKTHQNINLVSFEPHIKQQLKKDYLLIHPYVKQINPLLDREIIQSLQAPTGRFEQFNIFKSDSSDVLAYKSQIENLILKSLATQEFIIASYDDVLAHYVLHIDESAHVSTVCTEKPLTIDESSILNLSLERKRQVRPLSNEQGICIFQNLSSLTKTELKTLLIALWGKKIELDDILQKSTSLQSLLLLPHLNSADKSASQSLMILLKPYGIYGFHLENHDDEAQKESALIAINAFIEKLQYAITHTQQRLYLTQKTHWTEKCKTLPLKPVEDHEDLLLRAPYVMKHTYFSAALAQSHQLILKQFYTRLNPHTLEAIHPALPSLLSMFNTLLHQSIENIEKITPHTLDTFQVQHIDEALQILKGYTPKVSYGFFARVKKQLVLKTQHLLSPNIDENGRFISLDLTLVNAYEALQMLNTRAQIRPLTLSFFIESQSALQQLKKTLQFLIHYCINEPLHEKDFIEAPLQTRGYRSLLTISYRSLGFARQMEALKLPENYSTKLWYFKDVYQIYDHFGVISKNIEFLTTDKSLISLISTQQQELKMLQKALLQTIEKPTNERIEYAHLWHSLLGINLVNAKMQTLIEHTPFEKALLDHMKNNTLRVTKKITGLLDNQASIIQLILKLPSIYKLLTHEIQPQIEKLLQLSRHLYHHETKLLRSEGLARILVQLDEYEAILGLKVGLLSTPFENAFENFLAAFIAPAKLDAKSYIELISGIEAFEIRKNACLERKAALTTQLENLKQSPPTTNASEQKQRRGLAKTLHLSIHYMDDKLLYLGQQCNERLQSKRAIIREKVQAIINHQIEMKVLESKTKYPLLKCYAAHIYTSFQAQKDTWAEMLINQYITGRNQALEAHSQMYVAHHLKAFHEAHEPFYHTLNTIRTLTQSLRHYLNTHSHVDAPFSQESIKTWHEKEQCVSRLEAILDNDDDNSSATKLATLKQLCLANHGDFIRTFSTFEPHHQGHGVIKIMQYILQILQYLGLWVQDCQKYAKRLEKTLLASPLSLDKRSGPSFFMPKPEEESPLYEMNRALLPS